MNNQTSPKVLALPSGKSATIETFKGKHIREAQRRMSTMDANDAGTLTFMLISMLVTIDGSGIVFEDMDEMDGQDVLALMGEFTAANFR